MQQVELRILNADFEQIAVIRDFASLQWTPKYYDVGTFALQVGLKYAYLLPDAAYVYRVGTDTLGIIDAPNITTAYTMKGRFAEALLMRRVVNRRRPFTGTEDSTRVTYTGTVEAICRQIVDEYCINSVEPERNIPHLALGEWSGVDAEETTIQPLGDTVYDVIRDLLTSYEMSFRMRYDFASNTIYFEVFRGLDRTQSQTDNDWCIFSTAFYNVIKEDFKRSLDTRNFAYVVNGNEDNNEDEIVITIEIDDGKPRSEIWVQDNTRLTEDMTDEEFEASIRQTGLNKLAEYNVADTGECVIDATNAMGYALGDKCTYRNSATGITFEQRVTEIREVYEAREISTTIVIGKAQLTESKKIMRAVK